MRNIKDTSGAGEEKESQEGKDEEDVTNLDFEEISDGELEEERTRGTNTYFSISINLYHF